MDSPVDNQKQNIEKLIENAIELQEQGEKRKAMYLAQKAIKQDPTHYKSYYHLGIFSKRSPL